MLSWDRQSEWFELCWNNHEYTVDPFIEENPDKYPLQYDLKKWMGAFQSLGEYCMRLLGITIDSSVISSGEKSKNIKTKSTITSDSTLFLNRGTLQAQGLESKNINPQILNQNNIDDLQETLACLSTGFT